MTDDTTTTDPTRRRVLRASGAAGVALVGLGGIGSVAADPSNSPALGGRIYAAGELFATKDATDLPPPSGNNAHSFDEIYVFQGETADGQFPVAEAAPGEQDFNGGRWSVTLVRWADDATPVLLTSDDAVHAHEDDLEVVAEGARYFECPVVPLQD